MELRASFKYDDKLIEYVYDITSDYHLVGVCRGCMRGTVYRGFKLPGEAISRLAQFRKAYNDADPAHMLIRYLSSQAKLPVAVREALRC